MKFFKRHKTKDKATCNVGIRECRTCDNNIRCEECAYPSENETLKAEVEESRIVIQSYKGKYESAVKTAKELQTVIKEKDAEIERLLNPTTALWIQDYYDSQTLIDGKIFKSKYEDGYICSRCGKKSWVNKDICDGCKSVMTNAKNL